MKLTGIILLAASLQVSATAYSQKITLTTQQAPLESIFKAIHKQSGHLFIYTAKHIEQSRPVTIHVKDVSLKEALNICFQGQPFTYTIIENTVVVKPLSPKQKEKGISTTTEKAQFTVSGRVAEAETGAPLPGVSVYVKNSASGTSTDIEGNYSLELASDNQEQVLVFSLIGYRKQEILIDGQTVIDVVLERDVSTLDEVVVIGYGRQRQKEISGSVAHISEKDFNQGVNKDALDLLRGKVSGLNVTSGSGDVTSNETIRLRGTSSLTGSSAPFVVIDGVPGLNINSVAPQDIESISVLKDASAAAIYGSRSGGGVILITTKKGKSDQSVISYEGYTALEAVSNKPDMLTAGEWRQYVQEQNMDITGLDLGGDTDWFDEILRQGVSQNHSLSLAGGNEKSNYRASVNYLDRQGIAQGNDLQRLNARLAFTQKALQEKLEVSLVGALTQRDFSPMDSRNFVLAYNMIPVYPVWNEDGSWFDLRGYDQGNPVRNIAENKRENKNNLYYLNAQAKYTIVEGLTGSVNVLKERENNDLGTYNHSQTERGRDDQGFASRQFWVRDRKLLETTLDYTKSLQNNHTLNILGGYSYEDNYYQQAGAQSRQFVTDLFDYHNLGAGEDLRAGDVWSGGNMFKLISFFTRLNYSINNRYVLTAALRRDGSSKFGANHKWGTFPSISAAWNLADENFMKGQTMLDQLKLRVGYGVIGNQDGLSPYQTLQLYTASGQYYDDGSWFQAYQIGQNPNPDLKWEETVMFNVGLDFSFLDNRISGVLEFYDKRTNDVLYTYEVPVPPYLYPTMIANVGSMSNKGIEFMINGNPIRRNDFNWNVSLNLAHNKNIVTRLSNANFSTSSVKLGSASVRGAAHTTTHILEEGKPVGTFFGWRNLGLDEEGKYIMDELMDGKEGLSDDDRTYIGSAQPKLTYGILNSFSYKRFDCSFFLRGVYGNDVLNFSRMAYATTLWLPGGNALREALSNGLTDNPKYSSYNIEKGSFLRLDNASLGYTFDTQKIGSIKNLRVYVTGQNLFVITRYKGLDPEVDMSGLAPGMEGRDYYPKPRTVSLGLNVTL